MANRYWVGTGTWDSSNTANWSTSSGGSGGASVPVANDIVYIDQVGSSCTLGVATPSLIWIFCSAGSFFNTGNYAVTSQGFAVSGAGAGRSIQLGNAIYTVSSGSNPWIMPSASGFTSLVTSGATVVFNTQNAGNAGFMGGGNTYAMFKADTNCVGFNILDSNTFTAFYITGNSGFNYPYSKFSANQTIGTLTLNKLSTKRYRICLCSDIVGTQRTLTVTTLTADAGRIDFRDIVIAGAAAPISGDFGDLGHNSGITFTSQNVYWNKAAGGTWADADVWALTSGGSTSAENYPLPQDTAIIQNTGLNTGATITWGAYPTIINSIIDCSTRTNAMTLAIGSNAIQQIENITLSSAVTVTGTGGIYFLGSYKSATFTSAGATVPCAIYQRNIGGTLTLGGALTCSSTYYWEAGNLTLNNYNLTALYFNNNYNTCIGTMAFGTGAMYITGNNAAVFNGSNCGAITLTGSKNVYFTYAGATGTRTIYGKNYAPTKEKTFNMIFQSGTDILSIYGSTAGYDTLDFTGFSGTITPGAWSLNGNLILSPTMTINSSAQGPSFVGVSTTQTLTPNGKVLNCPITFNGAGSTFNIVGALDLGENNLSLSAGTLNTNDYTIKARAWVLLGSTARILNGGTSALYSSAVVAAGASWQTVGATNLTLNISNTSLIFTGATDKNFQAEAYVYGNIVQAGAGDLNINVAGCTFNDIQNTYVGATSITLLYNGIFNCANLTLAGSASGNVTLKSSSAGARAKIRIPFGKKISLSYATIKDIDAGGGASFFAPTNDNCVNNGNNLGWSYIKYPGLGFMRG